ncbi:MAG: flagellar FliJ family protein [Sulfurimonas sp.]|nr:flagellar FliJ family protein [Sulfurimonas sp.]
MKKSERAVQSANADLNSAVMALEISKNSLNSIDTPQSGIMNDFLASRRLLDSGRDLIKHNQEWTEYAKNQVTLVKEQLKIDMVEYEKFKYLDLQEIKKIIKKQKMLEAKELDEVALMTHARKNNNLNADN